MKPNPEIPSQADPAEIELLAEGARSYFDAWAALFEFRRMVWARCRSVLERQLTDYGQALGTDLKEAMITEVASPAAGSLSPPQEANIGVEQRDWYVGPRRCGHSLGLSWSNAPKTWFGASVGMWFDRVQVCRRVFTALKTARGSESSGPELSSDSYSVWISLDIAAEKMANLEEQLDGLLGCWIALWEKAGGLPGILTGPAEE